jgi:hypothetical protein
LVVNAQRRRLAPSFREERLYRAISAEPAEAKPGGTRVLHFTVQHDHLHLMVEGGSRKELLTLISRIAVTVNHAVGGRGQLFGDRYHRHDLTTRGRSATPSATSSSTHANTPTMTRAMTHSTR